MRRSNMMKYQKALTKYVILMIFVLAIAPEPAQAGQTTALKQLTKQAGRVLKQSPSPIGKLIANSPELVAAGKRLLRFLATHPIPAPAPNPWAQLLGLLVAAYLFEPAEFEAPPETPHSIREFYHDAPLFDFDQQ